MHRGDKQKHDHTVAKLKHKHSHVHQGQEMQGGSPTLQCEAFVAYAWKNAGAASQEILLVLLTSEENTRGNRSLELSGKWLLYTERDLELY